MSVFRKTTAVIGAACTVATGVIALAAGADAATREPTPRYVMPVYMIATTLYLPVCPFDNPRTSAGDCVWTDGDGYHVHAFRVREPTVLPPCATRDEGQRCVWDKATRGANAAVQPSDPRRFVVRL